MSDRRIGFLGLGIMGAPMASNLAAKGFEVVVWNRTAARADALRRPGVTVAASPAEAVRGVDVWCTCLADPRAVEEVVFGAGGALAASRAGQAYIDFSTGSVTLAKRLGEACARSGLDFVDAPVTGSRTGAQEGTLVVMAGASEAALARLQPVFAAIGRQVVHCGGVGAGTQVKLAANALIASMLQAFSEGALLIAKAGLDPRKFLEVVQASGYRSPYFDFKGKALLDHDTSLHFAIDLMHKDLTLMTESATAVRAPVPLATAVRQVYELARAAGLGGQDISQTIAVLEQVCGASIAAAAAPR
jgi:3-hydroxyisobutyrate dehydrogenase-like beta-hydroxyacid dehydrogenase